MDLIKKKIAFVVNHATKIVKLVLIKTMKVARNVKKDSILNQLTKRYVKKIAQLVIMRTMKRELVLNVTILAILVLVMPKTIVLLVKFQEVFIKENVLSHAQQVPLTKMQSVPTVTENVKNVKVILTKNVPNVTMDSS